MRTLVDEVVPAGCVRAGPRRGTMLCQEGSLLQLRVHSKMTVPLICYSLLHFYLAGIISSSLRN